MATALNNLGGALLNQGRQAEALEVYERCLAMSETVHGEDDTETATAMGNYATVLQDLKRFAEAQDMASSPPRLLLARSLSRSHCPRPSRPRSPPVCHSSSSPSRSRCGTWARSTPPRRQPSGASPRAWASESDMRCVHGPPREIRGACVSLREKCEVRA